METLVEGNKTTFLYDQPTAKESPGIGKLALALAQAQLDFKPIIKSKENPFFKSMYADLKDLIAATQPALAQHELVVIQKPESSEKYVTIVTRLVHSSGEWIESSLSMPLAKNTHQAIGEAISYGRRYAYQSMIGLAAENEDDGNQNAATPPTEPEKKKKYEPKPGKTDKVDVDHEQPDYHFTPDGPKPTGVPKAVIPPAPEIPQDQRFPNKEEGKEFLNRLRDYIKTDLPAAHIANPSETLKAFVQKKFGVSETKLLTFSQFSSILAELDSAKESGNLKGLLE